MTFFNFRFVGRCAGAPNWRDITVEAKNQVDRLMLRCRAKNTLPVTAVRLLTAQPIAALPRPAPSTWSPALGALESCIRRQCGQWRRPVLVATLQLILLAYFFNRENRRQHCERQTENSDCGGWNESKTNWKDYVPRGLNYWPTRGDPNHYELSALDSSISKKKIYFQKCPR